jgi:very-short-patch-repair endonuclease
MSLSPLGRGLGEGREPLRDYARKLRRNSTEAERLLWSKLRARQLNGIKFKRQVLLAGYIVDFVALERKLVIEVDGGQHGERIAADRERTAALEKSGYHVVRFWNNDVLSKPDGVLDAILQELHLAE